jgi:diguanylate cyclase (GGDEF)-like protein
VEKQTVISSLCKRMKSVTWSWVFIGCFLGYFFIHPVLMVASHIMMQSGTEISLNFNNVISTVVSKSFSIQMIPWGVSLALICAFAAGLLGRIRQTNAALRESERRYRELSLTDDLTKLFNSRSLSSRLQNELDRTQRYGHALSLLILDLDNFKLFNDTYGHVAGDRVLTRAGEILRRSLRKTDTAFRYGGEEFIALLPETTGHEAMKFAERIRLAFAEQEFRFNNTTQSAVTVSIGLAEYVPGEDSSTYINRADQCLYAAKRNGKNCIFSEV